MSNIKYQHILTKEFLCNKYEELGSMLSISKSLNIPHKTIREYFVKFKIPYKKKIRQKYNPDFFSKDTQESFYVAGFIAADGSVHGGDQYLGIILAIKDKDHLYKVRDAMGSEHIISEGKTNIGEKWYKRCRIRIGSKKLVSDLKRFNIVQNKTKIYTFPEWLEDHPLVNHFMRGYMDGDGCWRIHDTGVHPRSIFKLRGTEAFLSSFLQVLGNNCNIDISKKRLGANGGTSTLEFGGNIIVSKLADFLYKDATIYMDRKYEIAKQAKGLIIKKPAPTQEDILNLSKICKTKTEIAKKLGCSKGNVTYFLKKYKINEKVVKNLSNQ